MSLSSSTNLVLSIFGTRLLVCVIVRLHGEWCVYDRPSSFVSVDMERVANSRPMFMRHWVHDVTQFTMVWSNGRCVL